MRLRKWGLLRPNGARRYTQTIGQTLLLWAKRDGAERRTERLALQAAPYRCGCRKTLRGCETDAAPGSNRSRTLSSAPGSVAHGLDSLSPRTLTALAHVCNPEFLAT